VNASARENTTIEAKKNNRQRLLSRFVKKRTARMKESRTTDIAVCVQGKDEENWTGNAKEKQGKFKTDDVRFLGLQNRGL
jgi:hypothetical protein